MEQAGIARTHKVPDHFTAYFDKWHKESHQRGSPAPAKAAQLKSLFHFWAASKRANLKTPDGKQLLSLDTFFELLGTDSYSTGLTNIALHWGPQRINKHLPPNTVLVPPPNWHLPTKDSVWTLLTHANEEEDFKFKGITNHAAMMAFYWLWVPTAKPVELKRMMAQCTNSFDREDWQALAHGCSSLRVMFPTQTHSEGIG